MTENEQDENLLIGVYDLVKTFPLHRGVRKLFSRERKIALNGVNLSVRRNEIFGLLGPNGAGKTTLIKILCTLIRPTSGTATVDGHDVVNSGFAARQRIGLVNSDDRSHFWRLSARENLRFYAALNNVPPGQTEHRINELLELTGLTEAAEVRLSDFSSGMKQRLSIARGLLGDPEILFMDEPSRSLDPVASYDLRCFIRDRVVHDVGRTVILATNLMEEATFLCDRLALLNHGKVQTLGTLDELRYALSTDRRYQLTVRHLSPVARDAVRRLPEATGARFEQMDSDTVRLVLSVRKNSSGLAKAIRTLVEDGCDIHHCEPLDYTLDDVFRAVITVPPKASQDNRVRRSPNAASETKVQRCSELQ